MNLTDEQKRQVADWLAQGLKLSDVQKKLETDFGVRLTYMEVRFLIDDLKLIPKDTEHENPPEMAQKPGTAQPGVAEAPAGQSTEDWAEETPGASPAAGRVSVSLDQITRPGAVVSGRVTFSDGQSAQWHLDQMGRLGMIPSQQGYRPAAADVQEFQLALETELRKMGM